MSNSKIPDNMYKFTLKKAWLHLKTICKHKYWVFHYACKCGIPWQGFVHDLSKFSPKEFIVNVRYTTPGKSPIALQKELFGYSPAWFHHKGHNPHHYEYWMDRFDDGCYVNRMPFKYIVEALCDYLAANKAYNGKNSSYEKEYSWWKHQRDITTMHSDNIDFLDVVFRTLYVMERSGDTNENSILNKKSLYNIYESVTNSSTQEKIAPKSPNSTQYT